MSRQRNRKPRRPQGMVKSDRQRNEAQRRVVERGLFECVARGCEGCLVCDPKNEPKPLDWVGRLG